MSAELDTAVESGVRRRILQVAAIPAVPALVLFSGAGTLSWLWAWIYLGLTLLGIVATAVLMREHRETVAERSRAKGMRDWDKVVGGLWALCYFFAVPLVAGLDIRLGWVSQLAIAWHAVGIVVFAAGFALTTWSMHENRYFATIVRVQEDRDHTVCSTGPYRIVRHPGYVGAILQSLAVPVILGSLWALIPGAVAAALMTLRTALEDRALRHELAGYDDYAKITRCRLIPKIW